MEKILTKSTLIKSLEILVKLLLVLTAVVGFIYAQVRTAELLTTVSTLSVSTIGTFIVGMILE